MCVNHTERCLQFLQSLFVEVDAPDEEDTAEEGPLGESARATGEHAESFLMFCVVAYHEHPACTLNRKNRMF